MNILLTSTGHLEDREHTLLLRTFRDHGHLVESLSLDRIISYLKFDPVSQRAAIDAILIKADTDREAGSTYTLPRVLAFVTEFRDLPESCAMSDGRKWKSIPVLAITEHMPFGHWYTEQLERLNVDFVRPTPYPAQVMAQTNNVVDEYLHKVLADYEQLGIMFTFEKGRAQIGPAMKKKDPQLESAHYYAPADQRTNRHWVTVKRDQEAIRADIELFQQLIDMKVNEREMQRFFEQNPFFLSQLRLGVQVPHPSYKTNRWSPDFAFTSILGASDLKDIDLLELKGPDEELLNSHKHHPGFTSILNSAINQARDYGEYISHPANFDKIMKQFGYIPTSTRLGVVIGRDYKDAAKMAMVDKRRRYVPDIDVITYDKILATQDGLLTSLITEDMTIFRP